MVERASAPQHMVRACWVAMISVLALLNAGCGSSTTDDDQAITTATTEAIATTEPGPPLLDPTQLKAALLTVADMPPDWTMSGAVTGPNAQPAKAGRWANWFCDSAASAVGADQIPATKATFSAPLPFPSLSQSLISVPAADEVWQSKRAAFDSCLGQAREYQISMIEVTAPIVGDEAVAYRLASKSSNNYARYTNVVFARRGSVMELYAGSEFGDCGEGTFPPGQFNDLVTTGDQKVAAALAATGEPGQ